MKSYSSSLKNICSVLFFVIIVFLPSCYKTLDDANSPEFTSKLVVESFISPDDTTISVMVSKNVRIYGDQTPASEVKNATVELSSEDGKSVILEYIGEGTYQVKSRIFKLFNGQTYKMNVSTPDGLTASSTCMIPEFPDYKVEFDSTMEFYYNESNQKFRRFGFKIHDKNGIANYYRVGAVVLFYYTIAHIHSQDKKYVEFKEDLLNDINSDGQIIEPITTSYYYEDPFRIPVTSTLDSIVVNLTLYNVDYGYYKYHQSYRKFTAPDDPFAEPVMVYSNINNGLGIFSSFSKKEYRFRFK